MHNRFIYILIITWGFVSVTESIPQQSNEHLANSHPLYKVLESRKRDLKEQHLLKIFKLYKSSQHKLYLSPTEFSYRMKVFRKNLNYFIKSTDDISDCIKIDRSEANRERLIIIPDKTLRADFNSPDGSDLDVSFELNKFSDFTEQEFDSSFLLDQRFFDEKKFLDEDSLELEDSNSSFMNNIDAGLFHQDHSEIEADSNDNNEFPNVTPHYSTKEELVNLMKTDSSKGYSSYEGPACNFFNHGRILNDADIPSNIQFLSIDGIQIPTYLDWRQLGAIGPIKDQNKCNACYAFSALGAVEAHHKIQNGNDINLAEQEIVDCSKRNEGCTGGLPHLVYRYIRNYGISFTKDYPYDERKEAHCRRLYNTAKYEGYHIKGYINLRKGILNLIKAVSRGPLATISRASMHFKQYKGGFYQGQGCSMEDKPNHSSVLIGYNLIGDKKYLLFKNGWGSDWGDSGFYKMEIGELDNSNHGHCLIAATRFNSQPRIV